MEKQKKKHKLCLTRPYKRPNLPIEVDCSAMIYVLMDIYCFRFLSWAFQS